VLFVVHVRFFVLFVKTWYKAGLLGINFLVVPHVEFDDICYKIVN